MSWFERILNVNEKRSDYS